MTYPFTQTFIPSLFYVDMFTEQPHNTEVIEPGVATFQCKLADPTYSVFWFVNGSNARYTKFQQRGVSIETIVPYSESALHIEGSMENNNTLVFCGILLEVPQLMWINSRIASLLIIGRSIYFDVDLHRFKEIKKEWEKQTSFWSRTQV